MEKLLNEAIQILEEERAQLLEWAKQSSKGGWPTWSTYWAEPMTKRAEHLYNKINELKVKMQEQ